jgi:hypothetical protein
MKSYEQDAIVLLNEQTKTILETIQKELDCCKNRISVSERNISNCVMKVAYEQDPKCTLLMVQDRTHVERDEQMFIVLERLKKQIEINKKDLIKQM